MRTNYREIYAKTLHIIHTKTLIFQWFIYYEMRGNFITQQPAFFTHPPSCHLEKNSSTLPPMDSLTTGLILTLSTIFIITIIQRWWRHRRAAKLADKLLADIIKGKDAFRR
jgi:hypothetical protein